MQISEYISFIDGDKLDRIILIHSNFFDIFKWHDCENEIEKTHI